MTNPEVSAEIPEIVQPPGGAVTFQVSPLKASALPVNPGLVVPFRPQTLSLDTIRIDVTLTGALGGPGRGVSLGDWGWYDAMASTSPTRNTAITMAITARAGQTGGLAPEGVDSGSESNERGVEALSASARVRSSGGGGRVAPHHWQLSAPTGFGPPHCWHVGAATRQVIAGDV
jgi:hypothetical protein